MSCAAGGAVSSALAAALQFFAASQCLAPETWSPHAAVDNGTSWDFIVVGSGTAGAALTARLAALGGSVLLLEAGGDPPQETVIPGFHDYLKHTKYDWNFTSVDDKWSSQALRGGSQLQPRGRMLGGSGSLNDMVYARGFPADYDEWATIAGASWNWDTVLPYFKKTEHLTDERIINDPELMKYHGRGGEIEVAGLNVSTPVADRLLEAFKELGFPMVKDMTYPGGVGAGRFSHTIRDGQRDSTLTALLSKARSDNLKIVTNALVTKILIENNETYGVEVLIDGEQFTFLANKEVVVSAGTYNTAKLLLLSGIGPKEHLEDVGIPVIRDLPVGDNLQDHVMVLTYLAVDNGTCYKDEATIHMDIIKYLYDHTGAYSRTNSLGAYIAEETDNTIPEFAIYPTCVPMGSIFYENCLNIIGFQHQICAKLQSELEDHELMSLAVVRLKPKSRGEVRLKSSDPLEAPLIYSGTFSDVSDLEGFPRALKTAWAIANTTYFKNLNARVVDIDIDNCGNNSIDEESIRCKVKAMATSAWHAVGTAALGSVLDEDLKVMGLQGLRVVDASVMPKVVRGNTNAPVVMIAERAADFIKLEHFSTQV